MNRYLELFYKKHNYIIPDSIKEGVKKFKRHRIITKPFYEKYKYYGRTPIEFADKRGLVDYNLGIFYNRIPKAGNTTVVTSLSKIRNIGISDCDYDNLKNSFLYPSKLSKEQVEKFNKLFKFTIVRNPYTRILSAYLDKIASGKKNIYDNENDKRPTFLEFCLYLESRGLYSNIHWAPQTSFLIIDIDSFDFIGRLENIEEDLKYIINRISNINNNYEISKHSKNLTNANKKMQDYYCKKTINIVSILYKDDFLAFNYSINPYWF